MDEPQLVAKSGRAANPFLAQLKILTLGLKGIEVKIVAEIAKTYHLSFWGVFLGFKKTLWLIKSLVSYSLSFMAITHYFMISSLTFLFPCNRP